MYIRSHSGSSDFPQTVIFEIMDAGLDSYAEPFVCSARPLRSTPSGSEKKQARNKLPRAFLCYDKVQRTIFAGVVLIACQHTSLDGAVFWQAGQKLLLEEPVGVKRHDMLYYSSAFSLVPAVEEAVRNRPVAGSGESLNSAVFGYAGKMWTVIALDADACALIRRPDAYATFKTSRATMQLIGVQADMVDKVIDWNERIEACLGETFGDDADAPAQPSDRV